MPLKPWFEIRNAAEKGPAEILIYDRIGKSGWDGSGTGAKDFAEALAKIPLAQEILCCLNSPGGNVWDGLAIYHQLQARRNSVTIRIDGLAASIASIIAMAGKETRIPKNAVLMIHDPATLAFGGAADMRKAADTLDTTKKILVGIYHAKTGRPTAEIEAKMTAETWFTGQDAKDFGLVDTVTEEVALTASFDLTNFNHIPPAIRDRFSLSPGERAGVRAELPTLLDSPNQPDAAPKAANENNMNPNAETLSLLDKLKALFSAPENKTTAAPAAPAPDPLEQLRQQITNLQAGFDIAKTAHAAEIANLKSQIENQKEAAPREAASILAKLNVAPIALKADGSPAAAEKTLVQEYAAADQSGRNEMLAKYGAAHIAANLRKPRE